MSDDMLTLERSKATAPARAVAATPAADALETTVVPVTETAPVTRARRSWRIDPVLAVCLIVGLALAIVAIGAPWLSPFEPDQQKLLARLKPPIGFAGMSPGHWLGTDQLGRDILARLFYGLRLTVSLALIGAVLGLTIGTTIGLVSGLVGGVVDDLLMGLADVNISLPFILVALMVVALAGNDLTVLAAVLGLAYWAHFARLVRAQILSLREMPYVEAARAAGASGWRIAFVHMLPNITSPIIVMFTLNISNLILLESSLSFLGLGVQPPTASLGAMLGQGRDYMISAPWIVAAPAVAIVLVSLIVMLIGDALRDRLDVRLRDR